VSIDERTLFLIKPDGVQRGLIAIILGRIEKKGLKIIGLKMMKVSENLAKKHYEEHVGKPFFENLVSFITSSPIIAIALQGPNVIELTRNMIGKTNPLDALPGTIRADFGIEVGRNLVHGSDSPNSGIREVSIFFQDTELMDWESNLSEWITES
jgi:nucleoside-diphosphate kinase